MNELYPYYFDYAASTPMDPLVLDEMTVFLESPESVANFSSSHSLAYAVQSTLNEKVQLIQNKLDLDAHELIFTSGATESLNYVLRGFSNKYPNAKIITSNLEHSVTYKVLDQIPLNKVFISNNSNAEIDLNELEASLKVAPSLVSLIHVNNEIGTINELDEVSYLCRKYDAKLHIDASQTLGKTRFDHLFQLADYITVSAHKFYGPKGIGILFKKKDESLPSLIIGSEQFGRAGTLPTHQIVGCLKSLSLIIENPYEKNSDMHKAEQHLENEILACNAFILNAKNANRARSILSITIPGVHAQSLQQMITPYIVSVGSACNSLSSEPSRVLKAIGLGDGLANSTIRISIGRFTKIKDIDLMLEKLIHCSKMLKKISSDVPDWFLK